MSGTYPTYTGRPIRSSYWSYIPVSAHGHAGFCRLPRLGRGLPLNSILTKRGIKISRGTLGACDARMGVLNELISELKFIKFFAWED